MTQPPDVTVDTDRAPAPNPEWDSIPPTLRPRKRIPKWPFVVAGVLMMIGVGFAAAWPINVPYYALSPGPVYDVDDFISITDAVDPDPAGEMYFLTVSLKEVNLLEYLGGLVDNRVDLSPRENIRPAGVSQEDLRRQNIDLMETAKQDAIFVALTRLGYEPTFTGSGAAVNAVVEETAAFGVLQPGDIIVSVDGEPVQFGSDAVELIGGRVPGEEVRLEVNRPRDESGTEFDRIEFTLVLGPFRTVDEDGNVEVDSSRGMVGVLLSNAEVQADFPIDVQIDSQNIGGPSAGMMFTLQIIDLLDEEDLTHGARVAGTGTIDRDGVVGAIGGVKQKVYAAIDAGAQYVLVPSANFEDAQLAAADDITVVSIETIDDALGFLATL